jgi:flagellar biosynthesis/type III secretory pathway protein FliH
MSSLIKFAAIEAGSRGVRSFATTSVASQADILPNEQLLEARIAELEAEIRRLDEARPEDLKEAREAGARDALQERSDAEEQALKELKRALKEAQASWSRELKRWESLSIGLAAAVLERVFFDATDRSAQVASLIQRQLQRLDASSILRIRVSADDFSNSDRVNAVASSIGNQVELTPDPSLESGGCIVDLKLGHVALGPGAQWTRVAELLDRLERQELKS